MRGLLSLLSPTNRGVLYTFSFFFYPTSGADFLPTRQKWNCQKGQNPRGAARMRLNHWHCRPLQRQRFHNPTEDEHGT